MNWLLLFPSTLNPLSIILNLFSQNPQLAGRALSDTFILLIITIGIFVVTWTIKLTRSSIKETTSYLDLLIGSKNGIDQIIASDLPLFRELNHHLIQIPSHDGTGKTRILRTVDAAEIFSDSKLAPNFTTSRLFLAVPGILTGLGVLGTFIGLQLGIGGLDLNDLKNLDKSVFPLIQGCAIAFSTSVWGVLSSLIFSGLEKYLEGKAIGKIRKLQNIVDGMIPRYVPEDAMSELERTSRGTEEILKGLAVAIGDQMQKAIGRLGSEIKDAVIKATNEGQSPLAEKSAELLSKAITAELGNLKTQIDSMADMFSRQFNGVSEGLISTLKSFEPAVHSLSTSVDASQSAVTDAVNKLNAHEEAIKEMAGAAFLIKEAGEKFFSMNETLRLSSERNESAASAQLSAANANQKVANQFEHIGKHLPEIHQTIQDAAKVIASISGPVIDLKTYLEKLPDNQQKYEARRTQSEEQRNQRLFNMTGELAEKVGNAAEQFSKVDGLAQKLADAATSLKDAGSQLGIFGNQVSDASKFQLEASQSSQLAALHGERAAKALEPIPDALKELTNVLQAAGNSIQSGAESTSHSCENLITLQKQSFNGVEIGLTAIKDRLQAIIKAYGDEIEGQTRNLMNLWTQEVTKCLKTYQSQVGQLQEDIDTLQAVISELSNRKQR